MKLSLITEMPMRVTTDLPPDVYVAIEEQPGNKVLVYYSNDSGRSNMSRPHGKVSIVRQRDGSWEVNQSSATRGWGPLLYEVALEYATEHGGLGLRPDSTSVSLDASRVWAKFAARQDVTSHQIVQDHDQHGDDYLDRRYTKQPQRIPELERAGLLLVNPVARNMARFSTPISTPR